MQQTCTPTTLHRLNATARSAIQAVKRVVGAKVPKIARSSARPTARHNVLREDALDQNLESVVTW
jgi:hypothetical protein